MLARWSSPSTTAALLVAGTLLAGVLGVAVASGDLAPVGVVAGLTAVALALASSTFRRLALPLLGVLLIALGAATAIVDSSSLVSVAVRLAGLSLLSLSSRRAAAGPDDVIPRPGTQWILPVSIALGAYLVLSLGFHGAWSDLASYGVGLIAFAVVFVRLGREGDAVALRTAAMLALQIVLAASLVTGLAVASVGIEQGRLRGIIENANLLGFFAFLVGSMAVLGAGSRILRASGLTLAVITIAWTASRGSGLGLLIVLLFVLASRRPAVLAITAVVGAVVALVVVGFVPSVGEAVSGLLRDNNSRSDSVGSALALWQSSPLVGVGDLPANDFIASSPLRALANAGTGGGVIVAVLWLTILRGSWRQGLPALALGVAAVAHSVLEGWLLSPIGSLLMLFFLVWSSYLRPAPQVSSETSVPPTRSARLEAPRAALVP